jgi:hypothetical protein
MGLEGPLGGALYPNGTIEPLSRFVPSTFRDWRRDVPKGTMAAVQGYSMQRFSFRIPSIYDAGDL